MDLDFIFVHLKVINVGEATMTTTSYSAVAFEDNRDVTVPPTIQSVKQSRYSLYAKNGSQPSDGTFPYRLYFVSLHK